MKENGVLIKSDNALIAEDNGRFNASVICKKLKLPTEIVPFLPWGGEWHHVSAYANEVKYYDLEKVQEWLKTEEGVLALKEAKADRKAKKDEALLIIHRDVMIRCREYVTEWHNGRPRSISVTRQYAAKEVRIHPKKTMAEIIYANGQFERKKCSNLTIFKDDVLVDKFD